MVVFVVAWWYVQRSKLIRVQISLQMKTYFPHLQNIPPKCLKSFQRLPLHCHQKASLMCVWTLPRQVFTRLAQIGKIRTSWRHRFQNLGFYSLCSKLLLPFLPEIFSRLGLSPIFLKLKCAHPNSKHSWPENCSVLWDHVSKCTLCPNQTDTQLSDS